MASSILRSAPTRVCIAATFGASFLFMFLVAVCILTAQFNATNWPAVPWFPVPILAVVFATAWWCDRRWDIGLHTPCQAPVPLIAAFAITSNIAAHAVWVLEKSFHGTVYTAPSGPADVSLLFSATYWVVISVALSTSSEVCFRGVMQTQLSRYLGTAAAIGLVVLFNTFSHPWATLWPRFFGVLAILLAWGWLRHIGGSLRACILTHIAAVMIGDAIFWAIGPVDFSEYSMLDRAIVVFVGIASLLVSIYLSRRIMRGRPSGTPFAGTTLTAR